MEPFNLLPLSSVDSFSALYKRFIFFFFWIDSVISLILCRSWRTPAGHYSVQYPQGTTRRKYPSRQQGRTFPGPIIFWEQRRTTFCPGSSGPFSKWCHILLAMRLLVVFAFAPAMHIKINCKAGYSFGHTFGQCLQPQALHGADKPVIALDHGKRKLIRNYVYIIDVLC